MQVFQMLPSPVHPPQHLKVFLQQNTMGSISLMSPKLGYTHKVINNITEKANQTLGFLERNVRVHNKDLKSTAYKTLV